MRNPASGVAADSASPQPHSTHHNHDLDHTASRHALRRQHRKVDTLCRGGRSFDCSADRGDAVALAPAIDAHTMAQATLAHAGSGHARSSLPHTTHARSRWRWPDLLSASTLVYALLVLLLAAVPVSAVRVHFTNCLDEKYIASEPTKLQWVPLYADAKFDTTSPEKTLEFTVWGTVAGGEIVQVSDPVTNKATTLFSKVSVITTQELNSAVDYCNEKKDSTHPCPLKPVNATSSDMGQLNDTSFDLSQQPAFLSKLPSMHLSTKFDSSYNFRSFSSSFLLLGGDTPPTSIGCTEATITPDLGGTSNVVKFLPLVILLICGFAVVFAGNFSPWGSTDIFQWSSNYGRDADQLRLVTPGFGDCLQYIQFVVLTGALTISYPGFYQPIVSQAGWSTIMFNESFVTGKHGWRNVVDGIYVTSVDNEYGLQHMGQLIGMSDDQDIWAGMMVWLCVLIAAVFLVVQLGFLIQWIYRRSTKTSEEDLRAKNVPFSIGNIVRILYNFMLMPIIAFSTYQLVIAKSAQSYCVALACITLVVWIAFASYLLWLIIVTRPKSVLFDDLPIVLRFGPLYNTYSDQAATFAFVPIVLQFCRGVAIGAIQPSGLAQLVVLAICEVIQIFTLNAVKPFQSPTSMNAYHTIFSCLRLITILLMIAFVPSLGISEGPKGWIGYAILIIHGCVLIFGFLLSALQTVLEVVIRMMGAGRDSTMGQTRGGLSVIFGMRQLNKRESHRAIPSRTSQLSTSAMIDTEKANRAGYMLANGRVRSGSGASLGTIMAANKHRSSSILDSIDVYSKGHRPGDSPASYLPGTPGEASTFSFLASPNVARAPPAPVGHAPTLAALEAADPYYRPPRRRRGTNEHSPQEPMGPTFGIDQPGQLQPPGQTGEPGEGAAGISRGATPVAPATGLGLPGTSNAALNAVPNRPDYSTREVDFYYGVRGPALNSDGLGRKLGTGPADPTGPIATATGWFRNILGGKGKDKSKGFEVVRSSRMPPAMARNAGFGDETPPEGIPVALGVLRNGPIDDEDEDDKLQPNRAPKPTDTLLNEDGDPHDLGNEAEAAHIPGEPEPVSPVTSDDEDDEDVSSSKYYDAPDIPRKSSKRDSANLSHRHLPSLSAIESRPGSHAGPSQPGEERSEQAHKHTSSLSVDPPKLPNLPFERTKSQKRLSSLSSAEFRNEFTTVDLNLNDRPVSYGMVSQRTISRVDPEHPRAALHSSSAELVDENGVPKLR